MVDAIDLAGLTAIAVLGSASGDDLMLHTAQAPVPTSIDLGDGFDVLRGPVADTAWTIDGADSGHLGDVTFGNVENLTGAADNHDTFTVAGTGSLAGIVDGGAGGFDTIVLDGGTFTNLAYRATGPDAGWILRDSDFLVYRGMEPIIDNTDVVNRAFVGTAIADQVVLRRDPGTGLLVIESDNDVATFESVSFPDPTGSLTIDLGFNAAGSDEHLYIEALGELEAALTIIGGDGPEVVRFQGGIQTLGEGIDVSAEEITVKAGVVLDTRDMENGATVGDSGEIGFAGEKIALEDQSKLLAGVTGGVWKPGAIELEAELAIPAQIVAVLPVYGNVNTTSVTATNATIDGGDITITAASEDKSIFEVDGVNVVGTYGAGWLDGLKNLLDQVLDAPITILTGVGGQVSVHISKAEVTLTGSTVTGSGDVDVGSSAVSNASLHAVSFNGIATGGKFAISVAYGQAWATALTTIDDTSISGGGSVSVTSEAVTEAFVKSRASANSLGTVSNPDAVAVAVAVVSTKETAHVAVTEGSSISADDGGILIHASGEVLNFGWAQPAISDGGTVAIGIAVDSDIADVWTHMDGHVDGHGSGIAGSDYTFDAATCPSGALPDTCVNYGADTIRLLEHGLTDGESVTYQHEVGFPSISPLKDSTDSVTHPYYVQYVDQSTIQLAGGPSLAVSYEPVGGADPTHDFARLLGIDIASSNVKIHGGGLHEDRLALPSGTWAIGTAVVYLGAKDGGTVIVGITRGHQYTVASIQVDGSFDWVRLQDESGTDVTITLPGTGTQVFIYEGPLEAFHPATDVDSLRNTITFDAPHGFSDGDVVVYHTDPSVTSGVSTVELSVLGVTVETVGGVTVLTFRGDVGPLVGVNVALVVVFDATSYSGTVTAVDYDAGTRTTEVTLDAEVLGQGIVFVAGRDHIFVSVPSTGGDEPVAGLIDGAFYYVTVVNATTIRLATTKAAALAARPLDLIAGGSGILGTQHTLSADGCASGVCIGASLDAANPVSASTVLSEATADPGNGSTQRATIIEGSAGGIGEFESFFSVAAAIFQLANGKATAAGAPTDPGKPAAITGSIALNFVQHDVETLIGSTAEIASSAGVEIGTEISEGVQIASAASTTAEEALNETDISIAIALGLGIYGNSATTKVAGGARIDAADELGIGTTLDYGILLSPPENVADAFGFVFSTPEMWAYFNDGTLGLSSNLFNTYVMTSATGQKTAVGVSVAVEIFTNVATVEVQSGALLNQVDDARFGGERAVAIASKLGMALIHVVGVASLNINAPGMNEAISGGRAADSSKFLTAFKQLVNPFGAGGEDSVGGSLLVEVFDNTTGAVVAGGAVITAGGGAIDLAASNILANGVIQLDDPEGLGTGTAFVYRRDPGAKSIGGLTDGKIYYVIADPDDARRFRLAATLQDALDVAAGKSEAWIHLDKSVMTGTGHRLVGFGLDVTAGTDILDIVIEVAGSSASKFALGGAVSVAVITNRTKARLEPGVIIHVGEGALRVAADDTLARVALIGGVVVSENKGVGISIGVTIIDRTTEAGIGSPIDTQASAVASEIEAGGPVLVLAGTHGFVWTVTLAGAAITPSAPSTPPPPTSAFDVLRQKNAPAKAQALLGGQAGGTTKAQQLLGIGVSSTGAASGSSLGVAGDASITVEIEKTWAYINDIGTISSEDRVVVQALADDSLGSLAGGVAIVTQGEGSKGLAGSIAINFVTADTRALVAAATIEARTLEVTATRSGYLISITLAGSGAPASDSTALAGSVSVNIVLPTTTATVRDAEITLTSASDEAIVSATDTSFILAIAGALAIAGKTGVGISLSLNILGADDDHPAIVRASIVDSHVTLAGGKLVVAATSGDEAGAPRIIAITGAGAGSSGAGGIAVAGMVALNLLVLETEALVNSTIIEQSGSAAVELGVAAHDKSGIVSIGGSVAFAKEGTGVGAAIAYNEITATVRAAVEGGRLDIGGPIDIDANTGSLIAGVAVGVGVSTGSSGLAGAGSIAVNAIVKTVDAHIGAADGNGTVVGRLGSRAPPVHVIATDTSLLVGAAGSIAASTSGGTSIGAAITYNLINNHITAYVSSSTVYASDLFISASSTPVLIAIAVGGSGTGEGFTLAGSVAVNAIANTVDAHIVSATIDATSDIWVAAAESATLVSVAGAVGISLDGAAVGGAFAYDFIGGDFDPMNPGVRHETQTRTSAVSARIDRSTVHAGGSVLLGAGVMPPVHLPDRHVALPSVMGIDLSFDLPMPITSQLVTVTVGAAGAQGIAASGSISFAVLAPSVEAVIGAGSVVTADGSVRVAAFDDARVTSVAGALSLGTQAAVGIAASIVILTGSVRAAVEGSVPVTALGQGPGVVVLTGTRQGTTPATQTINGIAVIAIAFEDVTSVAAGAAASIEAGVAGSGTITVLTLSTHATVATGAHLTAGEFGPGGTRVTGGSILVRASDRTVVVDVPAGLSFGGEAGVGVGLDVLVIVKDTTAHVNAGAILVAVDDVFIDAQSNETVVSVAAAGSVGGTAGVAGSISVHVLDITTRAFAGPNQKSRLGTVTFGGTDGPRTIRRSSGSWVRDGFAVGQQVSIDGSVFDDGTFTVVAVTDSVLTVERNFTPKADLAGVDIAVIPAAPARVTAGGSVVIGALEGTSIRMIDGTAAGGTAGVAGSVSLPVVTRVTEAFIGRGTIVDALAQRPGVTIRTGGLTLGPAPARIALTGAPTLVLVPATGSTGAQIVRSSGSWLTDGFAPGQRIRIAGSSGNDGSYLIATVTASTITLAAGERLTSETDVAPSSIKIALEGQVTADDLGSALLAQLPAGAVPGATVATPTTRSDFTGLAVTAVATTDIGLFGVGVAGSATASVQVSGVVHVLTDGTAAYIGRGTEINQMAGAAAVQEVLVAAGNDLTLLGIAGAAGASGTAAVLPAVGVLAATTQVDALVGRDAHVDARADLVVNAAARQHVLFVAVGAAGSGEVAIGGAVLVLAINALTHALIGARSRTWSGGNTSITATDLTEVTAAAVAGGVGIFTGGVGAGVAVVSIVKDTRATIEGMSQVDADGNSATALQPFDGTIDPGNGSFNVATTDPRGVLVQAASSEQLLTVAIGVAGGTFFGAAGAVSVEVLDANTRAEVGVGAAVNASTPDADSRQDVHVVAVDSVRMKTVTGGFGIGGVGAGISVDVGVVRNDTTAAVLGGIHARRDVAIRAAANRDLDVDVIAGAAGGFGLAGSIAIHALGGDLVDTYPGGCSGTAGSSLTLPTTTNSTCSRSSGTSITGAANTAAGGGAGSAVTGVLAGLGASNSTTVVTQVGSASNAVSSSALGSAVPAPSGGTIPSGTTAFIGSGGIADAGRNVAVTASARIVLADVAGSVGIGGGAGVGAAILVDTIEESVHAFLASGATVNAGGDVTIAAGQSADVRALAVAGAASGIWAIGGAVAVVTDASDVRANVGDLTFIGATISSGAVITVSAMRITTIRLSTGQAGISSGAAIGAAISVVTVSGSTVARVGEHSIIGSAARTGALNVTADDTVTVGPHDPGSPMGIALGGGLATGQAGVTIVTIGTPGTDGVIAEIAADASIRAGATKVSATSTRTSTVQVVVGTAGFYAIGGAYVSATVSGRTRASIGQRANVDVASLQVLAGDTSSVVVGVVVVGLQFAGGTGAGATAAADANTEAFVGASRGTSAVGRTFITSSGTVEVRALGTETATATATLATGGPGLAIGALEDKATIGGSIRAYIGSSTTVTGSSVTVRTNTGACTDPGTDSGCTTRTATATATAAAVAALAGTGARATAQVTGSVESFIGSGTFISSLGRLLVTALEKTRATADARGGAGGAIAVAGFLSQALIGQELIYYGDATVNSGSVSIDPGAGDLSAFRVGDTVTMRVFVGNAPRTYTGQVTAVTATSLSFTLAAGSLGTPGAASGVAILRAPSGAIAGTRAWISAGSRYEVGRLDIEANANDVSTSSLLAVGVGLFTGAGGRADALVDADTFATIGGGSAEGASLVVTGSIAVVATSAQQAIANLSKGDGSDNGGGSGGGVAIAWLVGAASVTGSTWATIGDATTIEQASSVSVTSQMPTAFASAKITLGSAGVISIGGSQAFATSTPTIGAAIGNGVNIGSSAQRVTGDVTVSATGLAEADAKATAYGAGVLQVGIPEARATVIPWIEAYIGTDAALGTRIWTTGSIHVAATLGSAGSSTPGLIQAIDLTNDTLTVAGAPAEGTSVAYCPTVSVLSGTCLVQIGGIHAGNTYTVLDTLTDGVIRLGSLFDASLIDPDRELIRFDQPHGFFTGDCVKYDPRSGTPIVAAGQATAPCGGYRVIVIDSRTIRLVTGDPFVAAPHATVTSIGGTAVGLDALPGSFVNGQAITYHAAAAINFSTLTALNGVPTIFGVTYPGPQDHLVVPGNAFATGDVVTYRLSSGVAITGLVDGANYQVFRLPGWDVSWVGLLRCSVPGTDVTACAPADLTLITVSAPANGHFFDRHTLERSLGIAGGGALVDGFTYYVVDRNVGQGTIGIALAPNGPALDLTAAGRPGTHSFSLVTVDLQVGSGSQALYVDLTFSNLSGTITPPGLNLQVVSSGIQAVGDGQSVAEALGDSFGIINVSVPTGTLLGGMNVLASIGATRADALGDITITAGATTNLWSHADNGSGGVVDVAVTHADTNAGHALTSASIGDGAALVAGDDVTLTATANHTTRATAYAAGGGLAAAKAAESSVTIDPDTTVVIGEGASVTAGDMVSATATFSIWAASNSQSYSNGGGVGSNADEDQSRNHGVRVGNSTKDRATTSVVVGQGASIVGRAVSLVAELTSVDASSRAWAESIAAIGDLTARAFVNVFLLTSVELGVDLDTFRTAASPTTITGWQGVDLVALTDAVSIDRFAFHQGICACTQKGIAEGSDDTLNQVIGKRGVLVTAGQRPADGGGLRNPRSDLQVALYVKTDVLSVGWPQHYADGLLIDTNYVDQHCENSGDCGFHDDLDTAGISGADSEPYPGPINGPIRWDGDVVILGGSAGDVTLVVRADGTVAAASGVTVTDARGTFTPTSGPEGTCPTTPGSFVPWCIVPVSGGYTVTPIPATGYADIVMDGRDCIRNDVDVCTTQSNLTWPTFEWRDSIGSVTILDYSDMDVRVGAIDVLIRSSSSPAQVVLTPLRGNPTNGWTPLQFDVRHRVADGIVDIEKFGPGTVVLQGRITNPIGLTRVVSMLGSILGASGVAIETNLVDLYAPNGSIDAAAGRLILELIRYAIVPRVGSTATGIAEPRLAAEAGTGVRLSLRAHDRVPGSTTSPLTIRIDRLFATNGAVDVELRTSLRGTGIAGTSVVQVQIRNANGSDSFWSTSRPVYRHFRPDDTTPPLPGLDPGAFSTDGGAITTTFHLDGSDPLDRTLDGFAGTGLDHVAPVIASGRYALFGSCAPSPCAETAGAKGAGISLRDTTSLTGADDVSATPTSVVGSVDLVDLLLPNWLDVDVDGAIDLTETAGNLRVGLARSRGDVVTLWTIAGSILDGDPS
ncbi:MAG: hypothetical protein ABI620_00785, partial [Chloroflexota bacterium]